jgi:hypothetical protein
MNSLKALALVILIAATQHLPMNRGEKKQHSQTQAADGDTPAQSSVPMVNIRVSTEPQQNPAKANASDRHDWKEAFWPATWVNWALSILAGWAGLMALKTLRAIREQSQMVLAEKRARLSVEVDIHSLQFDNGPEWVTELGVYTEAKFTINNLGATNAFNVLGSAMLDCVVSKRPERQAGTVPLDIPNVIRNGSAAVPVDVICFYGPQLVEFIKSGAEAIQLVGKITYDDIYGNGYETVFRYQWLVDVLNIGAAEWQDMSHWVKMPHDNHAT